jgi:CHAT domain-containing protein
VFGHRAGRRLRLRPARFVVPSSAPDLATAEVSELARLVGSDGPVISALTPLLEVVRSGEFGLLHFACHNNYDPGAGSSIRLDSAFTPLQLTTAAIGRALAASAPLVFINACRSAGQAASYSRLDGWAAKFLEAGAAAFLGSLWAVSDSAAPLFAASVYRHLVGGTSLGQAVMAARLDASADGDPTWLAYTVYGDPRATVFPGSYA